MDIMFNEKNYFEINKISSVKSFLPRMGEYSVNDGILDGIIYVDITYFNSSLEDIFVTKEINYTFMLKDTFKAVDIKINHMDLEVIENSGVNCIYELKLEVLEHTIETKKVDEKEDIVELIKPVEEIEYKVENQDIKEDRIEIEDGKDEKPEIEVVKNKIEIIETKSVLDEKGFLNLFKNCEENISYLKMIHITKTEDFNKLSEKYNVSINDLYKSYDEKNKIVLIRVNE